MTEVVSLPGGVLIPGRRGGEPQRAHRVRGEAAFGSALRFREDLAAAADVATAHVRDLIARVADAVRRVRAPVDGSPSSCPGWTGGSYRGVTDAVTIAVLCPVLVLDTVIGGVRLRRVPVGGMATSGTYDLGRYTSSGRGTTRM
jgi:hypothetical protein